MDTGKIRMSTRLIWTLCTGMATICVMAWPAQAQFKYWIASDSTTAPAKLSQTGLYVNIAAAKKVVSPNIYHYEVNSPLWSDGAHKSRWVVARPGKPIAWDTTDYWNYPDSQVFVKEFDIDTIVGDTTSRVKWETRILFNRKELWAIDPKTNANIYIDHWYGYSYKWNKAQTDADLVSPKIGMDDSIPVWPAGKVGASKLKKWHFPSSSDCSKCHHSSMGDTIHDRSVLGFFTAQLNRPSSDTVATVNQLDYLFKHNVLTGTKPANWTTAPKWAAVEDQSASIDLRARSFIASNCSGCHGRRGLATGATTAQVNYDYYNMKVAMDLRHKNVAFDYYLNESLPKYYNKLNDGNNPNHLDSLEIEAAVIVPGYPTKSVLLLRVKSRRTEPHNYDPVPAQMPPLGSYEVYDSAVIVLTQWITDMDRIPAPNEIFVGARHSNLKSPSIAGRLLQIPADMVGIAGLKVSMTGISGRNVELQRVSKTTYAIPANLPVGLYLIRVGSQGFTRYLF